MSTRGPDEAEGAFASTVTSIGARVRRERRRRQLTVDGLARASGVSFGGISELERGRGNPSLLTLQRIGRALDLTLNQLLADPAGDEMVVRADGRALLPPYDVTEGQQAVKRELLTPRGQTTLQVIRSTIPPQFSNESSPFRHMGTESILIEQGSLLVVHGRRKVTLATGDSMTYGCSVAHFWTNPSRSTTIVLGAITPFEA